MPIEGGANRPAGEAPDDPPWYTGELPQPGPSQQQASGSPVSPSPWARPAPPPDPWSAPPLPNPNATSDATAADARKHAGRGGLVLVLVLVVVAAVAGAWFLFGRGGGSAAEPSRWTLDGAKAAMSAVGFTDGSSSALLDGRPSWLARGPESASFQAIGPPESITEVSLTVAMSDASSASDAAMDRFLATWAPDAASFVKAAMAESLLIEVDRSEEYADHSVHFQSLTGPDGTFVVVTVDRT